jgi:hypothetical protein
MPLRFHLVEHESMPPDGLSALTPLAAAQAGSREWFRDTDTFVEALSNVERCMRAHPDDVQLVVICTHGDEDTGTWFYVRDHEKGFAVLNPPFARVAPQTLVYLAICWGGYTAVVTRIQACGEPAPVVVGALAPLTGEEGNELQDALLALLLDRGIDEAGLSRLVDDFNQKYRGEYAQPVARIALRSGELRPPQEAAGIAWSLLRHEDKDRPNIGPFTVAGVSDQRVDLVDAQGARWSAHVGWLRVAKGADVTVNDRFTFKSKRNETANVTFLRILAPAQFHR